MATLFISCKRRDRDAAKSPAKHLRALGHMVRYDSRMVVQAAAVPAA